MTDAVNKFGGNWLKVCCRRKIAICLGDPIVAEQHLPEEGMMGNQACDSNLPESSQSHALGETQVSALFSCGNSLVSGLDSMNSNAVVIPIARSRIDIFVEAIIKSSLVVNIK